MRTYDMGGGKKLLIWVGSFSIAIGAIYGIRKWRDHGNAHDEKLQAALAVRDKLADFVRCLGGYDTTDLRKAVTFRTATGEISPSSCQPLAEETQTALNALELRTGEHASAPVRLTIDGIPELSATNAFCAGYAEIHAKIERIVDKLGGTGISPLQCDPTGPALELLQAPANLASTDRDFDVFVRDGLFISSAIDDGTFQLARTQDGVRWETQQSPAATKTAFWTPDGLVAITAKGQVNVADNGAWVAGARVKASTVDSIIATRGGSVLISVDARGNYFAQRSTDNSKTFGAPIKVFKSMDSDGRWDFVARVRPDGSLVMLTQPEVGSARFEGSLLPPDAQAPVTRTKFEWSEPGDGQALLVCSEGETIWGLVRQRHVVVTRDGGKSWTRVEGIAESLLRPKLTCSKDRLAILDLGTRTVVPCTAEGCSPSPLPDGRYSLSAVKLGSPNEVWLGTEGAEIDLRAGKPITVLVYRLDGGAMTTERAYTVETAGRLPVAFDGTQFLYLRR